jgi:hypothetical protein
MLHIFGILHPKAYPQNKTHFNFLIHFFPQVGPDGRWSNIWPDTDLNKGDTIYYWYYLVIDKKGYQVLKREDLPPLWNCSVFPDCMPLARYGTSQFFTQWGRIMVANFLIKSILFNRLVPMFQSISSRDTIPFKRGWDGLILLEGHYEDISRCVFFIYMPFSNNIGNFCYFCTKRICKYNI